MASRFVLTAQVQLQAPTNTRQVVNQIQQQLSGVNVQVNLQGGQQAAKQVNNLGKATQQATTQAQKMGKAFGASIRRFGAFTIATRAVSLFTNSLANATKEAIDFEREMIKISQVTGKTMAQLKGLENTITDLATSFGVSSKSILSVGRILAQAGIQAGDLKVALTALAKTELAPTFDDITQTAEGAVAVLAQFGEGVGALERQLGAINRVAGQFAVESGDLISAVRRTGGVFKAAGGELEELLALFTSVRATTRESAESIATGLRTIFTRIQRPATIEFLKQFGVELTDLSGKFVGPYEAVRRLSQVLSGLQEGDIKFVRIAEELGGFRQIGKVIPLLQQFETAERARQAALEGGNSLNEDAAKAQAALAVQIAKVKEEFLALIRSLTQTGSFNLFVKSSLELASALIKIADALKPLIPLLTAFAAVKFARGAAGFARGIGAGIRGGSPTGFARGGMVPGTGNRDTVPAMLTPGEFVIRKSSVSKLGAGTLAAMNQNGYEAGGKVRSDKNFYGVKTTPAGVQDVLNKTRKQKSFDFASGKAIKGEAGGSLTPILNAADKLADVDNYAAAFLRPEARGKSFNGTIDSKGLNSAVLQAAKGTGINIKSPDAQAIINRYKSKNTFTLQAGSLTKAKSDELEQQLIEGMYKTARQGAKIINGSLGIKGDKNVAQALKSANFDQTVGNLFELVLSNAGAPFGDPDLDPPNAPFDFPKGLRSAASKFKLPAGAKTEAKSFFTEPNIATLDKKVQNELANETTRELRILFGQLAVAKGRDLSGDDLKKLGGGSSVENSIARAKQLGFNVNQVSRGRYGISPRVTKATGGGISGSDTVPAMLTPGEFVFNKSAAKSIGYSNLNRMNKQGVKGYAAGGVVTSGRHNYGIMPERQRLPMESVGYTGQFTQQRSVSGSGAIPGSGFKAPSASTMITGGGGGGLAPITAKSAAQAGPSLQSLAKSADAASNETRQIAKEDNKSKKLKVQLQRLEVKYTNTIKDIDATIQGQFNKGLKQTGKDLLNFGKQGVTGLMNKFKNLGTSAQQAGAKLGGMKSPTPTNTGMVHGPLTAKQQSAVDSVSQKRGFKERLFGKKTMAEKRAMVESGRSGKATTAARRGGGADAAGGGGGGAMALIALTSVVSMIPDVEDAKDGFGAAANEAKNMVAQLGMAIFALQAFGVSLNKSTVSSMGGGIGGVAKSAGANLLKMAGVAAIAAFATKKAADVMDAYTGVKVKAKEAEEKAIETGTQADMEAAKSAATTASSQDALTKAGMAATVGLAAAGFAVGGPFGAAIGGAVGAIGTLILKSEGAAEALGINAEALQNFFAILGMGPTVNQTKASTSYAIASARANKILAESSKEAAEELKKIQSGDGTATGSLGKGGAAAKAAEALQAQKEAGDSLVAANNQQTGAFDRISQNLKSQGLIGKISGGIFGLATSGQRAANEQQNEQIKKDQIKAGQDFLASQSSRLALATKEQVTASVAGGGGATTFENFAKTLDPSILAIARQTDAANGNTEEMDKLKQNFENQKKAVIENIKFIKAMNFGLSNVTAGITAYGSSLDNLIASQETGFSTAATAAQTLATSISSAGKFVDGAELGNALDSLESNLSRFGANASQISGAKELITGLNDVQKNAASALEAVKAGFKGGATGPEEIKNQIRDSILQSVPDSSPIKQKLLDSFGSLELPPDVVQSFLNTGDVSGILDQAFGPIQEQVEKQILGPMKEMAEQEKKLVALTQQRRAAEKQLIDVQKKAIDTQIDAAKAFEEFGGAKFTPQREFDARRQQANLTLRDAGLQGLNTGSAEDIRRASDELFSKFSQQQGAQNAAAAVGGGAFGGVVGVETDRRTELKEANQALIDITKQGIEQRKKELELIQKKNQAEKDALNSLLGGDVQSFIDQSIASAAASALRTGDAQAASLFGAGALGQGLQGLQGTGLSDAKNQRAASLAFGAFGLGDRAAQVFTGTTSEEEKIKAEGRDLALLQGELAQQSTELERMNVEAKQVVINTTNAKMSEIGSQVNRLDAPNFNSRGGTIYASRGMFIPRGTDTVPAMLTPGEFVVNRSAVQRGNNLQILRAMNGGGGNGTTNAAGVPTLNRGGIFGRRGGSSYSMPDLSPVFDKFSEAVDKLAGLNISVKLETANVNVNFNGTSFLSSLNEEIRKVVLEESAKATRGLALSQNGEIKSGNTSVLGTA